MKSLIWIYFVVAVEIQTANTQPGEEVLKKIRCNNLISTGIERRARKPVTIAKQLCITVLTTGVYTTLCYNRELNYLRMNHRLEKKSHFPMYEFQVTSHSLFEEHGIHCAPLESR